MEELPKNTCCAILSITAVSWTVFISLVSVIINQHLSSIGYFNDRIKNHIYDNSYRPCERLSESGF